MKLCDECGAALVRGKHIRPWALAHPNKQPNYQPDMCDWCTTWGPTLEHEDVNPQALEDKVFGPTTWSP